MIVQKIFKILSALVLLSASVELSSHEHRSECSDPQEGNRQWSKLLKGNNKFVNNRSFARQRAKLTREQNPPAIVLCCSDSRVPPELVFDQGLGKLFVARVAGNIVDDVVIDSIEFAASNYDVSVLVVLGHTGCGAVEGALARLRKNHGRIDVQNGHLLAVLIPIEIAIVAAGIDIYAPNAVELATQANIRYSAEQLIAQSPKIARLINKGCLQIVGAEYSLKTGKVTELFVIDDSRKC